MKKLNRLVYSVALIFACCMVNAQDSNNPWAVSLGVNAVDAYPVGEDTPQGEYFDQYFNVGDHWNILPSISRLAVSRYIAKGFSITLGGSVNRIDKFGSNVDVNGVETTNEVEDLSYYAFDGTVHYSFMKLLKSQSIEPLLGVGGGYTWLDDKGFGTLNGMLGLRFWFNQNVGLEAQSTYKHSFENDLTKPKHFQHSLGLIFKLGGVDTDGDGIYDKNDECPEEAGLKIFNGCPDTDVDGIQDAQDDCPNVAGLASLNGCPDSDSDGIIDSKDDCPNVAGLAALKGCPDADGDGIKDSADNCIKTPGPKANKGCPWPDTDGDGILDKDDKCPNKFGVKSEQGCPKIVPTKKEIEEVNVKYTRSILFNTGKYTIKKESQSTINYVVEFLNKYPKAKFRVGGHTDSVGSMKFNQNLSEKRAMAVRDALIAKGISKNRITFYGYGEEKPIADNKTEAGRKKNRRVEITIDNN